MEESETNLQEPFAPLTLADLQKMVKHYETNVKKGDKAKKKNNSFAIEQTKWIWFSRKDIERLLQVLYDFDPSIPNVNAGIKMYIGVYDKDAPTTNGFDYTGQLTLGLVPSIKDVNGVYRDLPENKVKKGLVLGDPNYENKGNMCPPECNNEGDIA